MAKILKVKKRDGRVVDFDREKIVTAVAKAYNEVNNEQPLEAGQQFGDYIADKVCGELNGEVVDIEEIQDKVEFAIMGVNNPVAKAYITYRYRHAVARNKYEELMNDVKEKISAEKVQNQNANVDEHSFGGRIGETSDLIMKRYALDYCMSEMARNNHLNNEIYIHDLSHYAVGDHNCLSIPFDDLLANGFNTRQTDVRPAQSVSTAFQLVAVIFQLQSLQQFGRFSAC